MFHDFRVTGYRMTNIDTSVLAGKIASLVGLLDKSVPPLTWVDTGIPAARTILDAADEEGLFDETPEGGEASEAAIRALLYLRTGWVSEAEMHAQLASETDQLYIRALCSRHRGQTDRAKALQRELDGHAIYSQLTENVGKIPEASLPPPVIRFQLIVSQNGEWEPYAFLDLYAQALARKLGGSAELILRQLQLEEFNLLFAHVYKQAVGVEILRSETTARDRQRKKRERAAEPLRFLKPKTPVAKTDAAKSGAAKSGAAKSGASSVAKPSENPAAKLSIGCPSCGVAHTVAVSKRGQVMSCPECAVRFKIPA